jgi:hypothetical protein
MFRIVLSLALLLQCSQAFVVLPGRAFTVARCSMVETLQAATEGEVEGGAAPIAADVPIAQEEAVSSNLAVDGDGPTRVVERERHTMFVGNIPFGKSIRQLFRFGFVVCGRIHCC